MSDKGLPVAVGTDEDYERAARKLLCEEDHLYFSRFSFKARQSIKFIVNWHHRLVSDIVDDIIAGRRKNVVINVSPGSSKTELAVINFIARGLAINPWARFLHLSGSNDLATLNSATAREIVTSDEYQALWPLSIAEDSDAKKRWNVVVDGKLAGGVYATALGGQVTGFRAGHMTPGFQGAILIDDALKPEDAFSKVKTEASNRKLVTTVQSRTANPDTPILLIMQRISDNDATAFIEEGGIKGHWDFIRIPAIIDEEYIAALPEKYREHVDLTKGVNGRHSYWPYKEPIEQLLQMEKGGTLDKKGNMIGRHVFAGQYMQKPKALGGNIIKGEFFRRYRSDALPKMRYRFVIADTAQKTKERNDFSVFGEFGLGIDGWLYLLDLIRGRWEAPELQRRAIAFWAKVKARETDKFGQCRKLIIEDKSSGTGLIQTLRLPPHNIPIEGLQRNTDKVMRVKDALPYLEAGFVVLPEEAPFTSDFVGECESFTDDMTHDHDDQVDVVVDAVAVMLQAGNKLNTWAALGTSKA